MEGTWYQRVPFVRYEIRGRPKLIVEQRTLVEAAEVLFHATASVGEMALEAPLVFAGFGLDQPGAGFDDYAGLDVRGKIVVVLNGYPGGTASDVGAHLNGQKAQMAAARGAIGLITIVRRLPQGGDSRPEITWLQAGGTPFSSAPGLRFMASVAGAGVDALFEGAARPLSEIFGEGSTGGGPDGFEMARSARVELAQVESRRFTSPNVIAILAGSDPALADEYVLLMAHLDGLGVRERGEGDRIFNGAMDNAAGVATLIEVARRMAQSPNRPRRSILFAAVTAEEKGLLGAEYLARNPVVDGRIVSVVNLDMPILTYDFQDVIAFGAEHSTMREIVARAAERMGVRLSPDPLPQEGLFTRSDHYMFVREGIPAVFLMTGFAGGGEERFASFLANEYHSPADDLSLPFDWRAGARFAELNYLIARESADADARPLWYRDSFFGEALGGSQPRAERPQ